MITLYPLHHAGIGIAARDGAAQSTRAVSSPLYLYTCNNCLSGSGLYPTHRDILHP